jgi:hypothetical protein
MAYLDLSAGWVMGRTARGSGLGCYSVGGRGLSAIGVGLE